MWGLCSLFSEYVRKKGVILTVSVFVFELLKGWRCYLLRWGRLWKEQIWGKNTSCLTFDILSLRCLLDIQVKLWSRQLDMNLEFGGAHSSR